LGADPYIDVQRQAQIALGVQSHNNWHQFFVDLSPHMTADTQMEKVTIYAGVGSVLSGLR
jgi:hypothetical protein